MARDFIRESVWRSNINSFLAMSFIGVCALWAGLVIVETSWQVNPVASAFAAMVDEETSL